MPSKRPKRLVFCFADAIGVHDFFLKDSLGQFDGPLRSAAI
jgi:hypothetical protein